MRGMKDEAHLRSAFWNIAIAIYMEKNHSEMQDIPAKFIKCGLNKYEGAELWLQVKE